MTSAWQVPGSQSYYQINPFSSENHMDSARPVDLGSRTPVPGLSPADATATWEQKSSSEEALRKRTVVNDPDYW